MAVGDGWEGRDAQLAPHAAWALPQKALLVSPSKRQHLSGPVLRTCYKLGRLRLPRLSLTYLPRTQTQNKSRMRQWNFRLLTSNTSRLHDAEACRKSLLFLFNLWVLVIEGPAVQFPSSC